MKLRMLIIILVLICFGCCPCKVMMEPLEIKLTVENKDSWGYGEVVPVLPIEGDKVIAVPEWDSVVDTFPGNWNKAVWEPYDNTEWITSVVDTVFWDEDWIVVPRNQGGGYTKWRER